MIINHTAPNACTLAVQIQPSALRMRQQKSLFLGSTREASWNDAEYVHAVTVLNYWDIIVWLEQ